MKLKPIKWLGLVIVISILTLSCTKHGTKLTDSQLNENFSGGPVSDILVIAVTGNEETRKNFERSFVTLLNAAGVEAVSSAEAIEMPPDLKMEKAVILKAVDKFGSDAVIVTHLIGFEEKDVYTRGARRPTGYYGYYGFLYSYKHNPGYSSVHKTVRLETNLYDAKTESLIWSGRSTTWNPESASQVRNDVINAVIIDLINNKLIVPQISE
jgi:hypothetical protein